MKYELFYYLHDDHWAIFKDSKELTQCSSPELGPFLVTLAAIKGVRGEIEIVIRK